MGYLYSSTASPSSVSLQVSQDGSVRSSSAVQATLASLAGVTATVKSSAVDNLLLGLLGAQSNDEYVEVCNEYGSDTVEKAKALLTSNNEPTVADNILIDSTVYIGGAVATKASLTLSSCTLTGLSNLLLDGTPSLHISYGSIFNWDIELSLILSEPSFECSYLLIIEKNGVMVTPGSIKTSFASDIKILHSSHIELIPGVLHEESITSTVSDMSVSVQHDGIQQPYISIISNLANVALNSNLDKYIAIVGAAVTEVMWP